MSYLFSKNYTKNLEEAAMEQYQTCMAKPGVLGGALMPDAHSGYEMPIGGVIATEESIVYPAWVGVDIGCGVTALQLPMRFTDLKDPEQTLPQLFETIKQKVPTGTTRIPRGSMRNQTNQMLIHQIIEQVQERGQDCSLTKMISNEIQSEQQLGTLGSGNHFLDMSVDEQGYLWFVVHSGSRNLGKRIADHYINFVEELNGDKNSGIPDSNLEHGRYLADMTAAVRWAEQNRFSILMQAVVAFESVYRVAGGIRGKQIVTSTHNTAKFVDDIVIPGGKERMLLHRKGATDASAMLLGVIPGNMKNGSYIVRGLGADDWLHSCSHGAGRTMGRNQARKDLRVADFIEQMSGIICDAGINTLDESPGAYKNFEEVMDLQEDSVQRLTKLTPIMVLKDNTPPRKSKKRKFSRKDATQND